MKISFLVLVACLCFAAEVSARKERTESTTFKNDHGLDVNVDKTIAEEEKVAVNTYEEGGAVVEEEIKTIRTSTQAKRKGKRKQEKWVQAEQEPCSKILAPQIAECDAACNAAQTCTFIIESEDTCAWNCNCVQTIVEVIETAVETEAENDGTNVEKRKRKVKKEAAVGKKKRRKSESGKECSGSKKFSFSNCLIKLKGLALWGDDNVNFDAKFEAL